MMTGISAPILVNATSSVSHPHHPRSGREIGPVARGRRFVRYYVCLHPTRGSTIIAKKAYSPTRTPVSRNRSAPCFRTRPGSVVGFTSCATSSPPCRRASKTWSPGSSAQSSPNPKPSTCPPGLTPDSRSVRHESRPVAPPVGEEDWIHHDHEKTPAHAGTDRS